MAFILVLMVGIDEPDHGYSTVTRCLQYRSCLSMVAGVRCGPLRVSAIPICVPKDEAFIWNTMHLFSRRVLYAAFNSAEFILTSYLGDTDALLNLCVESMCHEGNRSHCNAWYRTDCSIGDAIVLSTTSTVKTLTREVSMDFVAHQLYRCQGSTTMKGWTYAWIYTTVEPRCSHPISPTQSAFFVNSFSFHCATTAMHGENSTLGCSYT